MNEETDLSNLISVVMPAFRQERTIQTDLRNVDKILNSLNLNYELIVVADGTMDGTFEKAREIEGGRLRVFGYPGRNRGKGYALRFGSAKARGGRIVFLDAGMDIDPLGISMLLSHMEWYKADAIVASKRHPVSQVDYPMVRRFTSFGYQMLVRLLFGLRIRDTQTGLKVFRREVLERVMPRLMVKDYAIDIEILAVAHHLGFKRIYEAPVIVKHSFASLTQASMLRTIFRMLKDTLAVFYRLKIKHYYDDGNERKWFYDPELQMRVNI
ncbi:MAG: glycosyltransferase [Patescibacteria group bacterium]|nr:glycosyltransferase [Patescibacteria group bacterium]